MNKTTMGLQARISKAAEILKIEEKDILEALEKLGIENDDFGLQLIDAESTNEGMISVAIKDLIREKEKRELPEARANAAVAYLKGRDPFAKAEPVLIASADIGGSGEVTVDLIKTLNKNTRNLDGMTDPDLLTAFIEEKDEQIVHILDRRSKHRPFVVLKSGSEEIDFGTTLELLKRARKMETPKTVPTDEGVSQVYRITELNPDEKMVEICPVCSGYLFKGRCSKCSVHFPKEVGAEARAYVKMLVDMEMFNPQSLADKRMVMEAAGKGVEGLKEAFPDSVQDFEREKKLGRLPKLIEEIEVTGGNALHPFYTGKGHKTY